MPYRARKTFKTGHTVVQEGQLYDTNFDLPDRFDEVVTPDSDEQPVKSPTKGKQPASKAKAKDTAKDEDE